MEPVSRLLEAGSAFAELVASKYENAALEETQERMAQGLVNIKPTSPLGTPASITALLSDIAPDEELFLPPRYGGTKVASLQAMSSVSLMHKQLLTTTCEQSQAAVSLPPCKSTSLRDALQQSVISLLGVPPSLEKIVLGDDDSDDGYIEQTKPV